MRLLVLTTVVGAIGALPSMLGVGVRAQIPAVKFDVRAAKGLLVSPVYEGWYEVDGTKYALFGYSNRNLEEIVDVPIGPQQPRGARPAGSGAADALLSGHALRGLRGRPAEGSADDRGDLDPHRQRADAVDSCVSGPLNT